MRAASKITLISLFFALTACATADPESLAVKEECRQLSELHMASEKVSEDGFVGVKPSVRQPPRYPFNRPDLRYVCVGVKFDVTELGETENHELLFIAPSSASPRYGSAALESLRRWEYEPATMDGRPARHDGIVTVVSFMLQ